jgi:hypothetical protein
MWYHVPANPRAILVLFHGGGGDASNWFDNPENASFVTDAVAAGFGVLSLSSSNRKGKVWELAPMSAANADVRNVYDALATLTSAGLITPATPRVAVGASNGGRFSVRIATLMSWSVIVNYVSQGDPDSLMRTLTIPTRFVMMRNDTQALVNWQDAQTYSQLMASRGVSTEFELCDASPLYPERFARIPGIDVNGSTQIYDAFRVAGLIDAAGYFTVNPKNNQGAWQPVVPASFVAKMTSIGQELNAAYGEHSFYGDANSRTLAFIAANVP